MADVQERQFTSLAERIAALNQQKNFQEPTTGGTRPPPPPVPNRSTPKTGSTAASTPDRPLRKSPAVPARPALPRRPTSQSAEEKRTLAPPLPSRQPSQTSLSSVTSQPISPALPPRRASAQNGNGRRNSNESDTSYVSTISALSLNQTTTSPAPADHQPPARRLPPALDQAKLPPLPPSRRELEAKAKEAAAANKSSPGLRPKPAISAPPPRPSLPPRLPSRPARRTGPTDPVEARESGPVPPVRRLPPPPTSYVRPDAPIPVPPSRPAVEARRGPRSRQDEGPPPVPLASRPSDQQIDAANAAAEERAAKNCLVCRDFSAADAVAALHPLSSLPRSNVADYLARVLCASLPTQTDKARAIFAWCHHNIAYDVEGFFGGCIPRGQTTDQQILSGKSVCEGYARGYEAIATRAGLECVVVTGHGKGYGFNAVKEGDPVPPRDPTGHAWNAVRLDDGRWQLLDACWGAGSVGEGRYHKQFKPHHFTSTNEDFGLTHFPSDARYFYHADGSVPTWEEYVLGPSHGVEPATWCGPADGEGLARGAFTPAAKNIRIRGGDRVVRFYFPKSCLHQDVGTDVSGRRRHLFLQVHGLDGRKDDTRPLEMDRAGHCWRADVPATELGAPGQKLVLFAFNAPPPGHPARWPSQNDKNEYLRSVWDSSASICIWELV